MYIFQYVMMGSLDYIVRRHVTAYMVNHVSKEMDHVQVAHVHQGGWELIARLQLQVHN